MRRLLVGECTQDNTFTLVDPTQYSEVEFEAEVVKALNCLMPEYHCGVFAGSFELENERHIADLALVHRSFSHWFVVEVELAGHSLSGHVLPQVRCFRWGDAEASCITSLHRAFPGLDRAQVEAILRHIPRYVAVVSNRPDPEWSAYLNAVDVQHVTVSVYRDRNGRTAYEMDGTLSSRIESLGFAQFSAIDNSLRMPRSCGLAVGMLEIVDQFGNSAEWQITDNGGVLWARKARGPALLGHNEYVQLIRTIEGRYCIRLSS